MRGLHHRQVAVGVPHDGLGPAPFEQHLGQHHHDQQPAPEPRAIDGQAAQRDLHRQHQNASMHQAREADRVAHLGPQQQRDLREWPGQQPRQRAACTGPQHPTCGGHAAHGQHVAHEMGEVQVDPGAAPQRPGPCHPFARAPGERVGHAGRGPPHQQAERRMQAAKPQPAAAPRCHGGSTGQAVDATRPSTCCHIASTARAASSTCAASTCVGASSSRAVCWIWRSSR